MEDLARRRKAIREKLERLDQAFLYERTIDIERYARQRDKLREELTLVQMDRHATELEEMDVEGILAFAERASGFQLLSPAEDSEVRMVDQTGASWNQPPHRCE